MSIGGRFILDINPKRYKVEEHIATKFEVYPWMLSTLKNAKIILSMKPEKQIDA